MPPPKRLCLLFTVVASIASTILLSLHYLHQFHTIDDRDVHVVWEKSTSASVKDGATTTKPTEATTVPNLVIAYSLWGSEARYSTGMINVCRTHAQLYPANWKIRIYHDNTAPPNIMDDLNEMEHVKLINVETDLPAWIKNNLNPMNWRFLIASDPTVSAYAVRDSDSIPSKRERAAIEEFLESGKAFHIIRDHPMHNPTNFAPILGGMWGGLHRAVPHMDELLQKEYANPWKAQGRAYAQDQDFLWQQIMPIVYRDCLQHDSYYCRESNAIAFPLSRKETNETYLYVGNTAASTMEVKIDSRLDAIDSVRKYENCLNDRKILKERIKSEGVLNFAAALNTTFTGQIKGLSTEAWAKWRESFKFNKNVKPKITIRKSSLYKQLELKNRTIVHTIQ